MAKPEIYLSGLAYELGELKEIQHLEELSGKAEILENMTALGLYSYAASSHTSLELAQRVLCKTLTETRIPNEKIDAVVFATNHFRDRDLTEDPLKRMLKNLGLRHAFPYGVSFSSCGNLHSALSMAAGLLLTCGLRNVLVVTSDKNSEFEPESRIYSTNVSILSDAAASVLVSTEFEGRIRWLATQQYTDMRLIDYSAPEQIGNYLQCVRSGIQVSVAKALAQAGIDAGMISQLITNNYNYSVSMLFATAVGVPVANVFRDNVPRFAHAYAADNLINLQSYLSAPEANAGHILLLGSGPNTWNTTVLDVAAA
jgi:3-oxoacyl-[acyl-carrier-protein] synthase-3